MFNIFRTTKRKTVGGKTTEKVYEQTAVRGTRTIMELIFSIAKAVGVSPKKLASQLVANEGSKYAKELTSEMTVALDKKSKKLSAKMTAKKV